MAPRTRSALRDGTTTTTTTTTTTMTLKEDEPKTRATRSKQNPKSTETATVTKGPKGQGKGRPKAKAKESLALALAKTQRNLRSANPGAVLRDITEHVLAPPTPLDPKSKSKSKANINVQQETKLGHRGPLPPAQSQSRARALSQTSEPESFHPERQPPIPKPKFSNTAFPTLAARNFKHASPLPPSSPPSTSSHLPTFPIADSNSQRYPTSSQYPYRRRDTDYLPSDPYILSDADALPDADVDPEDPFGFFAAEQRLKAARLKSHPAPPVTKRVRDLSSSRGSQSFEVGRAFATPKSRDPLLTPKKRKIALPGEVPGDRGPEGEEESMLSTPSPVKPAQKPAETGTSDVADRDGKGKGKAKEVVGRASKRAKHYHEHDDEEIEMGKDMHPMEIARTLEARLPRRPKRAAAVAASKRKRAPAADADSDDEEENKNPKIKSKYNPKGKSKNKGKGKAEESEDDEVAEKRTREREARIAYFRKLDGYQVQKEDVYVV